MTIVGAFVLAGCGGSVRVASMPKLSHPGSDHGRHGIRSAAKLPPQEAIVVDLLACPKNQGCRLQEATETRLADAALRSDKIQCKARRVLLLWVTPTLPFMHEPGRASPRCVTRQEAREWQRAAPHKH
jgi:hypothetical protein